MTLVKRSGKLFPKFMDDLLSRDFFANSGLLNLDGGLLADLPMANIMEDNKDFKLELAAPGLTKKDFKIETENNILTISSEAKKSKKEEKENYLRREFLLGGFKRSFQLPENSLPEKIEAHYENGILSLTLPKKEMTISKPKKEIMVA